MYYKANPSSIIQGMNIFIEQIFAFLFLVRVCILVTDIFGLFFFFFFFLCLILFYLTLQYCIGFAIYQSESAPGIHVFPILSPPPSSLPIPSLWVVPVHQPQASNIVHQTWTSESFHISFGLCGRGRGWDDLGEWH